MHTLKIHYVWHCQLNRGWGGVCGLVRFLMHLTTYNIKNMLRVLQNKIYIFLTKNRNLSFESEQTI